MKSNQCAVKKDAFTGQNQSQTAFASSFGAWPSPLYSLWAFLSNPLSRGERGL